ncbi:glycerol dehydrogenase [Paracoccus albus]|uniref:glycerol dehydrogenase n=1 Tax=Paracoccus albus TaxID=3017784 RepID=UPI0022EFF95D|nr:glycerol dehydrogenase [Paracoccus albus]WBU62094.1 glycerol dehydrogenase [Paracoccus albus]
MSAIERSRAGMIVFGSPSRYVQGPGALAGIGTEVARLGDSAVCVIDAALMKPHGDKLSDSCREAGVAARLLPFGGECTEGEVTRLAADAGQGVQIVIGFGGGKCIDAGKAVAHQLGAKVVTVPGIASTDAPTSHNYVLYAEDHSLLEVRKLPRNPDLVIVDTAIIAAAPRQFFVAGIGDAIGKCHEVRCCAEAGGRNIFGASPAWSSVALADACHDVLRRFASDALAAVDRGSPDPALERVTEAVVLMSGLAFESGGLSVAHSMTRGLTAVAPWSQAMHGLQVAYANIVQMRAQGADEAEIDDFAGFSRDLGLPVSLFDLGGRQATDAEIATIAELTMRSPHIGHLPRVLDLAGLKGAIRWVEDRYSGGAG